MAHVDDAVSAAFLAVIRPAELEASLALADDLARDQAQVAQQWQLRLERARYEADRVQRQYDAVEPENRLVARELERRWNEKLRAVTELEGEYRSEQERGLSPLTEAERRSCALNTQRRRTARLSELRRWADGPQRGRRGNSIQFLRGFPAGHYG